MSGRHPGRRIVLLLGAGAVGVLAISRLGEPAADPTDGAGAPAPPRAQGAAASAVLPATAAGEAAALALLRRAAMAAHNRGYSGTQFVSSWSQAGTTTVLADVEHQPGLGSWVRVAPTTEGDGASGFTFDGTTALAEPRALDRRTLSLLARHYDLTVEPTSTTCAGRTARVVDIARPPTAAAGAGTTGGPLAGRVWVDDATGLVLRREYYDGRGGTVRASAYVDLDTSGRSRGRHDGKATTSDPGEPVEGTALDRMRADGWVAPDALPGDLRLVDSRRRGSGALTVLHLTYTDGLSTVSLFAQRGRLDRHDLAGWTHSRYAGADVWVRPGLSQRLVWVGDGTVYTLVADAPPETVEAVVAALPRRDDGDSMSARMARGVRRVGSWVNPLG